MILGQKENGMSDLDSFRYKELLELKTNVATYFLAFCGCFRKSKLAPKACVLDLFHSFGEIISTNTFFKSMIVFPVSYYLHRFIFLLVAISLFDYGRGVINQTQASSST